ncbi:MAG: amidase [Actinomycetota bacterium]|jgi:amidase
MTDLHQRTALEIGALIAKGEVTPVECAEHFLARAEALDPQVGAFTTLDPERALAEAAALPEPGPGQGPLFGVPMAFKDMESVAGQRVTLGSAAFADLIGPVDSPIVETLRRAGVVSLGKTTTPELGLVCYTEPEVAPPARTPWDVTRSASGSSGGAAAAVAAGIVPWAQGADGAGSVRTPASACGLVGIKPSRGRISTGSGGGDAIGFSVYGPLARTVADAAAALDAMCGPQPGDTDWAPPAETSFLAACRAPRARLRVARYTTPPNGAPVDQACIDAVDRATALLIDAGHEVDEIACPFPEALTEHFVVVWTTAAAAVGIPPELEDELRPITRWFRAQGREVDGARAMEALAAVRILARAAVEATASFDVVLTPTLAQVPRLVGELRNDDDPAAEVAAMLAYTPFTGPYNASGQPAISVPVHWDSDGLPVGVQLVGRPYDEATLLGVAQQLEALVGWPRRHPPVW